MFRDLDMNISNLEKEMDLLETNLGEQKKHFENKIKSIIRSELLTSNKN